MITSPAWRGKRFAVLGLARSGAATVRALLASGAEVLAWDSDEAKRLELVQAPPLQGRGWVGAVSRRHQHLVWNPSTPNPSSKEEGPK